MGTSEYGHDMRPMGVVGAYECYECGAHDTVVPCPSAATCECTSLSRRSFTNTGSGGQQWWVCSNCSCPTAAWLLATLKHYCPGLYSQTQ